MNFTIFIQRIILLFAFCTFYSVVVIPQNARVIDIPFCFCEENTSLNAEDFLLNVSDDCCLMWVDEFENRVYSRVFDLCEDMRLGSSFTLIKSNALNKLEEIIFTVVPKNNFESNCSDGIDNDCDGEIDCDDIDCTVNTLVHKAKPSISNCSCDFLEIIVNTDDCLCGTYLSSSYVDGEYNWNTGSSDSQIYVNESGFYSVTVTTENGIVCESSINYEHITNQFTVSATGLKAKGIVICNSDNNKIYGAECSNEKIKLDVLSSSGLTCPDKTNWEFVQDNGQIRNGNGASVIILSSSSGIISFFNCEGKVFSVTKLIYNDIIDLNLIGGCNEGDYKGEYGWDNCDEQKYIDAKFYDDFRFVHANGSNRIASVMSLLNGDEVKIGLDIVDFASEKFMRDPNYLILFESSASSEVFAIDDLRNYLELKSSKNFTIESNCTIEGGNAKSPFNILIKDQCERTIGKLMVASGISQEYDMKVFNVGIRNYFDNSGNVTYTHAYNNISELENKINSQSFNQLFRRFKIDAKDTIIIDKSEAQFGFSVERNSEQIYDFLRGYTDIEEEHSEFVYFFVGYFINNAWSDFGSGEFPNVQGGKGFIPLGASLTKFVHEVGHGCRLCHTFKHGEDSPSSIDCDKFSLLSFAERYHTCDYMSYNDEALSFFYHHWINRM